MISFLQYLWFVCGHVVSEFVLKPLGFAYSDANGYATFTLFLLIWIACTLVTFSTFGRGRRFLRIVWWALTLIAAIPFGLAFISALLFLIYGL